MCVCVYMCVCNKIIYALKIIEIFLIYFYKFENHKVYIYRKHRSQVRYGRIRKKV